MCHFADAKTLLATAVWNDISTVYGVFHRSHLRRNVGGFPFIVGGIFIFPSKIDEVRDFSGHLRGSLRHLLAIGPFHPAVSTIGSMALSGCRQGGLGLLGGGSLGGGACLLLYTLGEPLALLGSLVFAELELRLAAFFDA